MGGAGQDIVDGGDGADRIYADILDQVSGGAGSDTIFMSGFGGVAVGGPDGDIFHVPAAAPNAPVFMIGDSDAADRLYYNGHLVTSPQNVGRLLFVNNPFGEVGVQVRSVNANNEGFAFRIDGSTLVVTIYESQERDFVSGSNLFYEVHSNEIWIQNFVSGDFGLTVIDYDTSAVEAQAWQRLEENNYEIGVYSEQFQPAFLMPGPEPFAYISHYMLV